MIFGAEKFWILDPLYAAFGSVLAAVYSVIPSFGVAIMLLTVAVSILRMPLVAKQVKSQQEMQRIQPELKRLQAKYKSEPQKRNEELMKLYKEHNVNPLAGCLPLLLQMPLFIVLYRLILDLGRPVPKHIPVNSDLYHALSESGGKMQSFGMDLAQAASKVGSFPKILPYLLVIGLVIATGMFQQRQMTSRLPKDAINTQVQIMGKIFPAFLGLISWTIPAGVVLYFFVSNVWQIGQQAVLFRRREAREAAEAGSGGKPDRTAKGEPDAVGDGGKGEAGGSKGGVAKSARAAKGGKAKPTPAKAGNAKAAARKPVAGKPDRNSAGRGNGKATGRASSRRARKVEGPTGARGESGSTRSSGSPNGRATPPGKGRAQAKGTAPQGRSRPPRGNSRKGK